MKDYLVGSWWPHLFFLFSSLEGTLTGGINCDALANITKNSSQWLTQWLSRTHRTASPKMDCVSSDVPSSFISLPLFQLYPGLCVASFVLGVSRWLQSPRAKIAKRSGGWTRERQWQERESERERGREGGAENKTEAWISPKSLGFSPSKLLEDCFLCFPGQYCLKSTHP